MHSVRKHLLHFEMNTYVFGSKEESTRSDKEHASGFRKNNTLHVTLDRPPKLVDGTLLIHRPKTKPCSCLQRYSTTLNSRTHSDTNTKTYALPLHFSVI